MPVQLKLWENDKPAPTVAQYVYRTWLWFYRGGNNPHSHPSHSEVMTQTAKYLEIPEDLISRIVHVQSRWEARKVLRGVRK